MKTIRQFTALIEREGDGYVALCPDLDVASQGDTIDGARTNLLEAVELFLETADESEVQRRLHTEVYVTRLEVAVVKLPILSGREVMNILRDHGFTAVRQKGSHVVMQARLADTTITVPVPDHKELRTGTLSAIIRQSGLPRPLFEQP